MTAGAPTFADGFSAEGSPPPHVPLWLLALFTFSGTLAMHIFVPALAMAGRDLGAGNGAMQMTVSLYIIGLAVGQLIYGPLSDRYGRRRVLMAGRSEEHTSELQSLMRNSYAVFCLKKKK